MKRHNKALELLAKSKEHFYEQQVKRQNRIDELRLELQMQEPPNNKQTKLSYYLINRSTLCKMRLIYPEIVDLLYSQISILRWKKCTTTKPFL